MLEALNKYATLSEKNRADLTQQAQATRFYGISGQIYEAVKAGDHAGAAKLYQPILADLKKSGVPGEEAVKVRAALSNVLQLALQNSVQEGTLDRAQDILKLLEQVSAGGGSSGPLVQVIRDVQIQINDLKKQNPERLKDTVDKFGSFLDDVAKQPNLSNDVRIFLAQGFASLDKPARAVELLAAIPEPADPGLAPVEPKDGASDDDKKKYEDAKSKYDSASAPWRTYHFVQLTRVRALRQMGRDANDPKSPHFDAAAKLVAQMVGTPQKKGWAFNNLEVRRETIFILEDRGLYADAMKQWLANQQPFVKQMVYPPQNPQQARIREVVYEYRYYITRCVLLSKQHSAALAKDAKRKNEEYHKLAKSLVGLEKDRQSADFGGNEVKKLYKELLDSDDLLRKAYIAEGGSVLLHEGEVRTSASP